MIRLFARWLYWRYRVYRVEHKPGPTGNALARFWVTLWVHPEDMLLPAWETVSSAARMAGSVLGTVGSLVPGIGPVGLALGSPGGLRAPTGGSPLRTLSQLEANAYAERLGLLGSPLHTQAMLQVNAYSQRNMEQALGLANMRDRYVTMPEVADIPKYLVYITNWRSRVVVLDLRTGEIRDHYPLHKASLD